MNKTITHMICNISDYTRHKFPYYFEYYDGETIFSINLIGLKILTSSLWKNTHIHSGKLNLKLI